MQGSRRPLTLTCATVALVVIISGSVAQAEEVQNEALDVSHSTLKVIPPCGKRLNVSNLTIKENMIALTETDKQALATYPTLAQLHLDRNWVTDVPAHFFSVVPRLQVLSLSHNRLRRLDPRAFDGLGVLTELDLSHNNLTSLPSQLLRGTVNLKKLHLQENPWNCSCSLLSSIYEITAANISIGSPGFTCASPENQAGKNLSMALASCDQTPGAVTDPRPPTTAVTSQQSTASSTALTKTQSSGQNQGFTDDQTPVVGNSWKFTACIVALALTTSALIVCSIKGPSWYKLFHNYRHRPLHSQYDEDDSVASTDFAKVGRHHNRQTFSFSPQDGQIEEEDEYYEDPYIKREE